MPLSCFICAKEKDGKLSVVIPFKSDKYEKCKNVLRARKAHSLKFSDVILPEDFMNCGYHASCYKDFASLHKKYSVLSTPEILTQECLTPGTSTARDTNLDPNSASQAKITNGCLFKILRTSGLTLIPFDSKHNDNLVQFLLRQKLSHEQKQQVKGKVNSFRKVFIKKWERAVNSELNFGVKSKVWLEKVVFNTERNEKHTGKSRGRPTLSFEKSKPRTRRLKVTRLVNAYTSDELLCAYRKALWKKGERSRAEVVEEVAIMPHERITTLKKDLKSPEKLGNMTGDDGLAFIINNNLSKSQYLAIRHELSTRGVCTFPSYHKVLDAKKKCLPPEEDIRVTETSAEIKLQSLADMTAVRLVEVQKEVILQHPPNDGECVLIWKWGMDGSSNQAKYKQKFAVTSEPSDTSILSSHHPTPDPTNSPESSKESKPPQPSDANMFNISAVPLRLEFKPSNSKDPVILWQNTRPGSVRYCRPIKFLFEKECDELVLEQKKKVELEIKNLALSNVKLKEEKSIKIKHEFHLTMVDGKTCNAIAGNKATGNCYLCGCKPSEFNNLKGLKAKVVRKNLFSLGLSILHAWIKCYECILHIGYRLKIKNEKGCNVYQVKTEEHKKIKADEKTRIFEAFKSELGLIVDKPKQGGGNSNDGNTARRFFENSSLAAEITGVNEELIKNMHTILAVLASGFSINVDKFRDFTEQTAELYVKHYSWYPMPPTVHKILLHGGDIIDAFELPIGCFTEEALECRNKDYRKFRAFFSRKNKRTNTNSDIFRRLLLSSDPVISSTQIVKAKKKKFTAAMISLFKPSLFSEYDEEF